MFRLIFGSWLKFRGWKFEGDIVQRPDKFIVIVLPHTASSDFSLGIMAREMLRLNGTKYLGKSQLFKFPFGFFFRATGGYPVDRSKYNNLVDAVVDIFNKHKKFSIALAPEGTRAKVERLKTGFYFIAKQANIPIIPVSFDYPTKTIKVGEGRLPTEDMKFDFQELAKFYHGVQGKYPELGPDDSVFERSVTASN